jgi:hypothetical protein
MFTKGQQKVYPKIGGFRGRLYFGRVVGDLITALSEGIMKDEIERKLRETLAPIKEEWAAYRMADGLCLELSRLNLALMNENRQAITASLQKTHRVAHRLKRRLNPAD